MVAFSRHAAPGGTGPIRIFDDLLKRIQRGEKPTGISTVTENFQYYGISLRVNLIHYSVWEAWRLERDGKQDEAAQLVRKVLQAGADATSLATSNRQSGNTVVYRISAFHIAAGLGCVAALEVLRAASRDRGNLMSSCCFRDGQRYNQALHEALLRKKAEAALWLMRNSAPVSEENQDGMTPILIVAKVGMDSDDDLKNVVDLLRKRKGSLSARDKKHDLTPVETAALGCYAQDLLHLLASSLQDKGNARANFFKELSDVAAQSPSAAEELVRSCLQDDALMDVVRLDAQRAQSALRLAVLYLRAPQAAAALTGALLEPPRVRSGMHPIPRRVPMRDRLVRCQYQPDFETRADGLKEPMWEYDELDQSPPQFHGELVEPLQRDELGRDHGEDVEIEVNLMSHLINLPVCIALAGVQKKDMQILDNTTQRGIIAFLHTHLAVPSLLFQSMLEVAQLLLLMPWIIPPSVGDPTTSVTGSDVAATDSGAQLNMPSFIMVFCWSFMAGCLLRDAFNMVLRCVTLYRGWTRSPEPCCKALWKQGMFSFGCGALMSEIPCMLARSVLLGKILADDMAAGTDTQFLIVLSGLLLIRKISYAVRILSFSGMNVDPIFHVCVSRIIIVVNQFVFIALYTPAAWTILEHDVNIEEVVKSLNSNELWSIIRSHNGSFVETVATLLCSTLLWVIYWAVVPEVSPELDKDRLRLLSESAKCNRDLLLSMPGARTFPAALKLQGLAMRTAYAFVAVCALTLSCYEVRLQRLVFAMLVASWLRYFESNLLMGRSEPCWESSSQAPKEDLFLWICQRRSLEEP